MSPEQIFPIFVGSWVVLGLVSFMIFFRGKNVQLKRKLLAPFIIGAGVLFTGFTYAIVPGGQALYIIVPAVILITIFNLRSIIFCDSCGKITNNQNFLVKPEFCSKCGEKL